MHLSRRRSLGLLATALLPAPARAGASEVGIDNFTFSPPVLTVAAGSTVVFTNRDDLPHSVVSARSPPAFRSRTLDTDDSFTRIFDTPGEWRYFCGLHPHMQGVIVVT
jgi:plastocyanin